MSTKVKSQKFGRQLILDHVSNVGLCDDVAIQPQQLQQAVGTFGHN